LLKTAKQRSLKLNKLFQTVIFRHRVQFFQRTVIPAFRGMAENVAHHVILGARQELMKIAAIKERVA
jgi:hypothetical protein